MVKFIIVGIGNTVFSAIIMFLLYNVAGFGYWGSSSVGYILGSISSFVLNKNFTFQNKDSIVKTAMKFTINIMVCYLIAYSLAKPIVNLILSKTFLSQNITEQISMLFGMCIFTVINYVGQRCFVFYNKRGPIQDKTNPESPGSR